MTSRLIIIALFICLSISSTVYSQILPQEGQALHYRIIGFSFPKSNQAKSYTLQIAQGSFTDSNNFNKNIVTTITAKTNRIVAQGPAFGAAYTWRVRANTKQITSNTPTTYFHFTTLTIPEVDSTLFRLNIITPAKKYTDAFILADGNKVMYNMQGQPVWFLPDLNGKNTKDVPLADIKLSPTYSLTCLLNNFPYEITYNGDIIWFAPNDGRVSGDTAERYHHEFTKLHNNHYMALGNVMAPPFLPADKATPNIMFGTLMEYDEHGKVIWSWKSAPYFQHNDFKYFTPANVPPNSPKGALDPHENGFYFDEKNKNIYISCKNISRIVKVHYPTGKITNAYGERFKPNTACKDDYYFSHQHNPCISSDGNLMVFNNGTHVFKPGIPSLIMFKEGKDQSNSLQKIWEFDFKKECNFSEKISGGGSFFELPDKNFFVTTGQAFGEFFIISRDKKIIWRAIHQKKNIEKNTWETISNYRASIIVSKKDLEKLIWQTNKKALPK